MLIFTSDKYLYALFISMAVDFKKKNLREKINIKECI